MSLPFLRTLQGDRFFQLLILVGIGLSFFVPIAPKSWPAAIDWHTIITLSGLMLLTKGVEYDSKKMVGDIKRPAAYLQAA